MSINLDRRERIVTAAARLFAERGIATTTVRMIGDEVGVLSGSLYHYFASKEDIVDAIIGSYFGDLLDRYSRIISAGQPPRAMLGELVRESFRSIAEYPEACEIYRNDYKYLAALPRFAYVVQAGAQVQDTWLAVIESGRASAAFRAGIDPRLLYRFMRDAIWQSARWYRLGGAHSMDEIADTYIDVLLNGIAG